MDQPAWQAHFRGQLGEVVCAYRPTSPKMEEVLKYLQDKGSCPEQSLVRLFGRDRARRFYRAALDFFQARPWQRVTEQTRLGFRDRRGTPWELQVVGAEGREFGLMLVSQSAHLGLGFVPAWMVAAPDLDLLDREEYAFEVDRYPWAMNCHGGTQTVVPSSLRNWNGC